MSKRRSKAWSRAEREIERGIGEGRIAALSARLGRS